VSEPPALEATAVSKRYGDRDALCGVDLIARRGQLHGLLGSNGAGKTTLMRVLLGLIRRDAGSVRILGREVATDERQLADASRGSSRRPRSTPT
jgi:ABC-type multidrug transport system ATPase subunit